jgi:DeoR family transcriptional regulator, fructose operon transcriptional repressor
LLALERQKKLLKLLEDCEFSTFIELSKKLDVSSMTIRRDIRLLSHKHQLVISHGGVSFEQVVKKEIPYSEKREKNIAIKRRMAKMAASIVNNGESIVLGSGTSNFELAKLLLPKELTVITADLSIAYLLAQSNTIQTYVTGGFIDSLSSACVGPASIDFLDRVNVDKVFLGCMAWSLEYGVTTPSINKAELKRKMISVAEKRILISDHTKFDKHGLTKIADLCEFDLIITDRGLNHDGRKRLKKIKTKVQMV